MQRLIDWQGRLYKLISEHEQIPFQFGQHDCAIWAGKVVESVTGEDFYSSYVGTYKTLKGGLRQFKKATGFPSHIKYIENSFEEVPLSLGRIGDLALIDTSEGPAVAVMAGQFVIALNQYGLVRIDLDQVKAVFKVGV